MAENMHKELLDFLQSQRLLVLATTDGHEPWAANVYYGADANGSMYFVSSRNTKHSANILIHPTIAFSVAWFDPTNHKNRRGVQGLGICHPAKNEEAITAGVTVHNKYFPEFRDRITVPWIHKNEWSSIVWVLKPTRIKFWNDELFGDDESEEFTFE